MLFTACVELISVQAVFFVPCVSQFTAGDSVHVVRVVIGKIRYRLLMQTGNCGGRVYVIKCYQLETANR